MVDSSFQAGVETLGATTLQKPKDVLAELVTVGPTSTIINHHEVCP